MSILILGLSGVGKSTVCGMLSNTLNVPSVNLGRLILERSQNDVGFRILTLPEQRKTIENELASRYPLSKLLIDAHAVFFDSNGNRFFGFDSDDLRIVSARAVLLIESDPHIIIRRRASDRYNRPDRKDEGAELLSNVQAIQRLYLQKLCGDGNVPLHIFDNNPEAGLEVSLSRYEDIIRETF